MHNVLIMQYSGSKDDDLVKMNNLTPTPEYAYSPYTYSQARTLIPILCECSGKGKQMKPSIHVKFTSFRQGFSECLVSTKYNFVV